VSVEPDGDATTSSGTDGARERVGVGRLLLGVLVAICGCILPTFLVGGLAVQLRDELGFAAGDVGAAVAASFSVAALTSAVIGRWVQARSAAQVLRAAAVAAGVLQLAVALLVQTFAMLLVSLAVAGVLNAAGQVSANLLLARAAPLDRQGLAFGAKQAGMPAATMLAGAGVPLAVSVGWRWAYVAAALLAFLGALLVPQVDRGLRGPRSSAASDAAAVPASPSSSRRALAALAAAVGVGAAAAGALLSFLVSSAVDAGISPTSAGLLLTGGSMLGMTVRVVAGVRADRREGGLLRVVAAMLGIGGCGMVALSFGQPTLTVLAVPVAFGAGWAWPGLFNLAVVRANPGAEAAATGITQTGTYLGAVVGPLAVGAIVNRWGFGPGWWLVAVLAWAASAMTVVGRSHLRAERHVVAPVDAVVSDGQR
jgi:predicted MFS family arabinose efflux permease